MYSIRPANFLDHYRQAVPQKRKKILFAAFLMAVVLAVVSIFALRSLLTIAHTTRVAKDHLLYSIDLARDQRFQESNIQIREARVRLHEIQRAVRPWKFTIVIPFVGRQVRAFDHAVAAIDRLSSAFSRAILFGEKITRTIGVAGPLRIDAITTVQKRQFLAQLFEATPVLQGIKADVDLAVIALNKIPDHFLVPALADAVEPLKKRVPIVQHAITTALPLLEAVPLVSGYPEPQRYLFLFQNNDELRPTGGFIGTYGILELRDGNIQSLFTDNIYRLDRLAQRERRLHIPSPAPVQRHLGVPFWYLRDVNWSPDFPETARQALWFYERESNDPRRIDGVLAITPTVVVRLLQLIGPITVDKVNFTAENIVDSLQFHVEKGYDNLGIPEVERKEIIGKLTTAIIDRMFTLSIGRIPDLLDIIAGALRERHILLYAVDPVLQHIVVDEGWSGALASESDDYLMVVDANLAALKTDSVMEKSIAYALTPDGDGLTSTVTMTYHNKGFFSWKTTRYRSYTRLYVPRGATLIRSEGFIMEDKEKRPTAALVSEELDKTVFGGFFIVEPGDTKTIRVTYRLPKRLAQNAYRLRIQKQAGTEAHPLHVSLQFNKKITQWTPTGFTVIKKGNMITFPTDLRVDRQFAVDF